MTASIQVRFAEVVQSVQSGRDSDIGLRGVILKKSEIPSSLHREEGNVALLKKVSNLDSCGPMTGLGTHRPPLQSYLERHSTYPLLPGRRVLC